MSYNPVNWVNGETPINDTNLNNMDNGIADAHSMLEEHESIINEFVNQQLPEEYVKEAVDTYVENNSAGFATAADLEEVESQLDSVNSEVDELSSEIAEYDSMTFYNMADENQFVKGKYMTHEGNVVESTNYFYTNEMAVKEGETVYFNAKTRFITAFKNGVVSKNDGVSDVSEAGMYIVPSGVTSIIITSSSQWLGDTYDLMVNRGDKLYPFTPYGERIVKVANYEKEVDFSDTPQIAEMDIMQTNEDLLCDFNCIVKNKSIVFRADIDTAFGSLVIGQGLVLYGGNALAIDDTNIQLVHYEPQANILATIPHGLTIKDFISVSITVDNQRKASVLLTTSSGGFLVNDLSWGGTNGEPFARARNCTLSKAKLVYTCKDYAKEIWVFGDSYITTTAPTRYPYYLNELGVDNYLLDGFGGRNSAEALVSLKNALKHGTPKYLLWLLGMNDADGETSSNASWYSCYSEVVSICKEKGITPIFARIPNVPTVTNWYKNRVVEYSGYRYIDFANAVGANERESTWYDGLLSGDGVHPSENGAKVLANQLLIDFPEITAE